jgi:hypothetical protein
MKTGLTAVAFGLAVAAAIFLMLWPVYSGFVSAGLKERHFRRFRRCVERRHRCRGTRVRSRAAICGVARQLAG